MFGVSVGHNKVFVAGMTVKKPRGGGGGGPEQKKIANLQSFPGALTNEGDRGRGGEG